MADKPKEPSLLNRYIMRATGADKVSAGFKDKPAGKVPAAPRLKPARKADHRAGGERKNAADFYRD